MNPVAVRVENLGKKFLIGHQKTGDLRQTFRQVLRNIIKNDVSRKEEFWALRALNFEIGRGEVVGIIGKNGAGKSTLLKILSRITDPTTGRFEIDGRVSSLLEVGTGFHMELSGRENIFLNGTILGMKRAEIKGKFDEIVAFSGVENFIDTPVKHYSSGMKVRLAFSVAAHLEPEILIIDEVLAVGDAEFQKKCLGKMDEVSKQKGRTILFVSHNLAAVEHLCSLGILLNEGGVTMHGKVDDVIKRYLMAPVGSEKKEEVHLANHVFLEKFVLTENISAFSDVDFEITFSSPSINCFNEVAILVYNHLQERIGIVDLRHADLRERSSRNKVFTIKGSIKSIPLIEGNYQLGLYVSSTFCRGDFLNIQPFEVRPIRQEFIPYALKHRGSLEFKSDFEIL